VSDLAQAVPGRRRVPAANGQVLERPSSARRGDSAQLFTIAKPPIPAIQDSNRRASGESPIVAEAVDQTVMAVLGGEAEYYPETLVTVAKLAFARP